MVCPPNANDTRVTVQARHALLKEFAEGREFYQLYHCPGPSADDYVFSSFDGFFNRKFKNSSIDHLTGDITNLVIIGTACELVCYARQSNV